MSWLNVGDENSERGGNRRMANSGTNIKDEEDGKGRLCKAWQAF